MSGENQEDNMALVKRLERLLMDQVRKDMVVYGGNSNQVKKQFTE